MSKKKMFNREINGVCVSSDGASLTLSHIISEAEKAHIVKVLRSTKGNKKEAAEILGISRKTLWEKIKSYDIRAE